MLSQSLIFPSYFLLQKKHLPPPGWTLGVLSPSSAPPHKPYNFSWQRQTTTSIGFPFRRVSYTLFKRANGIASLLFLRVYKDASPFDSKSRFSQEEIVSSSGVPPSREAPPAFPLGPFQVALSIRLPEAHLLSEPCLRKSIFFSQRLPG